MKHKALLVSATLILGIALLMWRSNRPPPAAPNVSVANSGPVPRPTVVPKPIPLAVSNQSPAPAPGAAVIIPHSTNNTSIAQQSVAGNRPKPAVKGAAVAAVVTLDGKPLSVGINQLGYFPRLYVAPDTVIPVNIQYPGAKVGEKVVAEAGDGGRFANGQSTTLMTLDPTGSASFSFRVSGLPGTHRVALFKGRDLKAFDFWVGPENTFVKR